MKITINDIKKCLEEDEDFFINYLNNFEGGNVHEKFVNILKNWEKNVSYSINFRINEKNLKISLDYIIKELGNFVNQPTWFEHSNIKVLFDIPSKFIKDQSILTVSNFINKMEYGNFVINFTELTEKEKEETLEKLPAEFYNRMIQFLIKTNNKKITLQNSSLDDMEINFLTSLPYEMVKGLFFSYDMDYFRDIIYYLSKKIDGKILMDSTIMDVEYYIDKMKTDNNNIDNSTNLY
jgi:hypothetical protein